jgi:hypothetical protein
MNDRLVEILNLHLAKIQELQSATFNSEEFAMWHVAVKLTLSQCNIEWKNDFLGIEFYPPYIIEDSPAYTDSIYRNGLVRAQALLAGCITLVPVLDLSSHSQHVSSADNRAVTVTVNLNQTISQTQSQKIFNEIELEQYDPEVQDKVKELFNELEKEEKDKPKIKSALSWLADKGADALMAIILHSSLGI